MEVENKDEFVKMKDSLIHHTQYTDVFLEVVTINEKLYVGLQRTSYFEDEPRLKIILVPIEAWTTLQTESGAGDRQGDQGTSSDAPSATGECTKKNAPV